MLFWSYQKAQKGFSNMHGLTTQNAMGPWGERILPG
jgi:hypothetical protein